MLSILIPTYNYNITKLVTDLHKQASDTFVDFEILVMEDGSTLFLNENKTIERLKYCTHTILPHNIGRAAIRNKLADSAKYDHLLFIDCDAEVFMPHYIEKYLSFCNENSVVVGGTSYDKKIKNSKLSLRLKYGRKREAMTAFERAKDGKYSHFSTFNFLISKTIFQKIRFDESLKSYGHEDTLFGHQIAELGCDMHHIDNPLLHNGLDDNKTFLTKTEVSVRNLYQLYQSENYPFLTNQSKLLHTFTLIKEKNLIPFLAFVFAIIRPVLKINLYSKFPSLRIFDLYKLLYLASITS